jgi:hypothetical protein
MCRVGTFMIGYVYHWSGCGWVGFYKITEIDINRLVRSLLQDTCLPCMKNELSIILLSSLQIVVGTRPKNLSLGNYSALTFPKGQSVYIVPCRQAIWYPIRRRLWYPAISGFAWYDNLLCYNRNVDLARCRTNTTQAPPIFCTEHRAICWIEETTTDKDVQISQCKVDVV